MSEEKNVIHYYDESISLEEAEKQYIDKCVNHFDGNLKKAASKLGISRTTLYRKLNEMASDIEINTDN